MMVKLIPTRSESSNDTFYTQVSGFCQTAVCVEKPFGAASIALKHDRYPGTCPIFLLDLQSVRFTYRLTLKVT